METFEIQLSQNDAKIRIKSKRLWDFMLLRISRHVKIENRSKT